MKRRDPLQYPLLRRFIRDTAATTAAEFALVIPFFLLMVFGTINLGITFSAVSQIHYAAERAARCLSTNVSGNCAAGTINTYAKGYYKGPSITGLNFIASTAACGNKVVGSGSYQLVTGFSGTAVSIRAQACYPLI